MKALFYKDVQHSAVWIGSMCILIIVVICIMPNKTFRLLLGMFSWIYVIPSALAMADNQENAQQLYSIMPIKKTFPVSLRYIYLASIGTVVNILYQTIVCVVNRRKDYEVFNINNMVVQSILTMLFAFASLWLMASLIVRNRFINAIIVMMSAATFGIVMSIYDLGLDFTKIDLTGQTVNHKYDFLLRYDFHIVFWCACLLTVVLSYLTSCAVLKKKQ